MANVLSSFLIGIEYDYDDQGEKKIGSGIDSIKSKALQLGAVVAGAFGIKSLTSDFASSNDSLGKFSKTFGLIPNEVAALGRAAEHEGGSIDSLISQLENLERIRAATKTGDFSASIATGIAGLDIDSLLKAENSLEGLLSISNQFKGLNQQQRLNAASALGFDDATIRLLSNGEEEIISLMKAQQEMRPVTSLMTEEAARFNDEWQDLQTNIGGFSDRISSELLPAINDILAGMNDWIQKNREFLTSGLDKFLKVVGENIGSIAAGAALISASGTFSAFAKLAGIMPGVATGAASLAGSMSKLSKLGVIAIGLGFFLENSDAGDSLSAGSIFGDNSFTKFIDTPIEDLFNSGDTSNMSLTPRGFRSARESVESTASTRNRRSIRDAGRPIKVEANLHLDGKVIERKIINVTSQQYEQALDDVTTSEGG